MIELKEQYPFIDEDGNKDEGLILHWAEDEFGTRYYIIQVETGLKFASAVDIYPCRYTYQATNEPVTDYWEG